MKTFPVSIICALALLSTPGVRGEGDNQPKCPGSPAWKHAKCVMTLKFPGADCSTVQSEISQRLNDKSWIDPHNQGTYKQNNADASSGSVVEGERLTGDGKYTDKFMFTFVDGGTDGGASSCEVSACSESQCFSILDFSTNFCNLRNLYCNTKDGCPVIEHDLEYEETYVNCSQNKKSDCIAQRISSQ